MVSLYGGSTAMPTNISIFDNDIFGVHGSAISLGLILCTTISDNRLNNIVPVSYLGQDLSIGVQANLSTGLQILNNSFENLIVSANLPATQATMSNNSSGVGLYLSQHLQAM